jgi:hypothetical protein
MKKIEPFGYTIQQYFSLWIGDHAELDCRKYAKDVLRDHFEVIPLYREPPAHHPDILQMALDALDGLIKKHRHTHGLDGAWDAEIVKSEMASELLRNHLSGENKDGNASNQCCIQRKG